MRRCIFFLIIFSIFITAGIALAKDFKSPHKLEAGQTLSADVLNEIVESLSVSHKIPARNDFLGTWSCDKAFPYDEASYPGYILTVEQEVIYTLTGTLDFSTDGNGKYFLTEDPLGFLAIRVYDGKVDNEPYGTKEGVLFFQEYHQMEGFPGANSWFSGTVTFRGENQFVLTQSVNPSVSAICNKNNIPPEIPDEATTSISGNSITLTWTDRSEDETGFVIIRRDKLDGQWAEIATVDPATGTGTILTYTDTGLSSGTYWYRVKSVNAHGKSLGSNVSKVDI